MTATRQPLFELDTSVPLPVYAITFFFRHKLQTLDAVHTKGGVMYYVYEHNLFVPPYAVIRSVPTGAVYKTEKTGEN